MMWGRGTTVSEDSGVPASVKEVGTKLLTFERVRT
jgi:hypothetical protein